MLKHLYCAQSKIQTSPF